jgi:hypothetical protein
MKNPKVDKKKQPSIASTTSKAKLTTVTKEKLNTNAIKKNELQPNTSDKNLINNIATVNTFNTVNTISNANVSVEKSEKIEKEEEIAIITNTITERAEEKEEIKIIEEKEKEIRERDKEIGRTLSMTQDLKLISIKTNSADINKDDDPKMLNAISPKRIGGPVTAQNSTSNFVPPDVGGTERIRVVGRFRPLNAYETVNYILNNFRK